MSKKEYYTSESNEKEPKGTIHDIKISTFTEDPSDPQSAYYTRILNESIGDLVEWAKPKIPDNPESRAGQASLEYANILNSGINELNRCLMEEPYTLKMVLQCMTATLNVSPGELVVLFSA